MANLYRTLEDISLRLIMGVAEHGLVEGVDESLPLLVSDSMRSLAIMATYIPGQGLEVLADRIEVSRDLELVEGANCPSIGEMPKVITAFNQLIKRKNTLDALSRSMEDIETGDPNREFMAYERLGSIQPSETQENPDSLIILPNDVERIPSIIPDRSGFARTGTIFDRWCLLGPGETGVILGQPNAGKSAGMVDLGAGYAELNEGLVFHFSEEMGLGSVVGRYDRRVGRGARGRAKLKLWESLMGNIVVEAHPAKTATVGMLEERVTTVCGELNMDPIAILVDAAYLLKSSGNYTSSYDSQNEVIIGLRAMAARLFSPVWTCVQPQRNSARAVREARLAGDFDSALPLLDMHDVAECWAIPQTVDYLVSLNQSTEERNMKPPRVRLNRCKVREVDKSLGDTEPVLEAQADYDTCTFI